MRSAIATELAPVYALGMAGLGDNIYQRPFVRAMAMDREVYLSTPWPELYEDIEGVQFVRYPRASSYRTQEKNIRRQPPDRWAGNVPRHRQAVRFWYGLRKGNENPWREFDALVPTNGHPLRFDLPDFGPSPVEADRIAVVRPVTIRKEWPNPARNPLPEYVAEAAQVLREHGYTIVSVADVAPPLETFVGPPPETDYAFHAGELDVTRLLALIRRADVVTGGVGWIVPAGIASRTPLVVTGGGLGGHNAPERLTDPRMDTSRVRWVLPDRYCRECRNRQHDCQKAIPDFAGRFAQALREVA